MAAGGTVQGMVRGMGHAAAAAAVATRQEEAMAPLPSTTDGRATDR